MHVWRAGFCDFRDTLNYESLNGGFYGEITVFVSLLLVASWVKCFALSLHFGDILSLCCAQLRGFSVLGFLCPAAIFAVV